MGKIEINQRLVASISDGEPQTVRAKFYEIYYGVVEQIKTCDSLIMIANDFENMKKFTKIFFNRQILTEQEYDNIINDLSTLVSRRIEVVKLNNHYNPNTMTFEEVVTEELVLMEKMDLKKDMKRFNDEYHTKLNSLSSASDVDELRMKTYRILRWLRYYENQLGKGECRKRVDELLDEHRKYFNILLEKS